MLKKWIHISEAVEKAKRKIKRRFKGEEKSIKTPWVKMNSTHLGGIEWGMMLTLAGLSGVGKTLFMGQLYRDLHKLNPDQQFIIVLFNFEMTGERLVIRDVIAKTGFSKNKVLSADGFKMDQEDLTVVAKSLDSGTYKSPILLVEKPCTPTEYVEILRGIYEEYKLPILAISDHSLLFEGEKASDKERQTLVELALKIMTLKNEGWSSHIVLTQLNRDLETPARRTPFSPLNYPDKSCIFGSDALYQASDTVMVIHRPYILKFPPQSYGPDKLPTGPDDIYFHFIKLRDGDPTIASMKANFQRMEINDSLNF